MKFFLQDAAINLKQFRRTTERQKKYTNTKTAFYALTLLTALSIPHSAHADGQIHVQNTIPYLQVVNKEDKSNKLETFDVENIVARAGKRMKIDMLFPTNIKDSQATIEFHGLPKAILLSPGSRVNDVWRVPANNIKNLTLISPYDFQGEFRVTATLNDAGNYQVINSKNFIVKVVPEHADNTHIKTSLAKNRNVSTELSLQKTPKNIEALIAAHEAEERAKQKQAKTETQKITTQIISPKLRNSMMKKAQLLLSQGDIQGARFNFKFIADKGDAEGALWLAKTFDPEEFKKFKVVGMQPNRAKAIFWYDRATKLGNQVAAERLQKLVSAKL